VPTFVEQGLPDVVVLSWFGLSGPGGLPAPLAQRLNELTLRILHEPEMVQRLQDLGSTPNRMTRADFTDFVANEISKWRRVVQAANIRLE